jgi:anti-anti-sigma regulatory factor
MTQMLDDPEGSILTSIEPGRAIVWLAGRIDCSLADDFAELCAHARELGPHLVVEVTRMTFCDSTLTNFLAAVSRETAVTVRRPSSRLAQALKASGLSERVQVANFPGPAPALPA